jgi:hypothetical protein
LDRWCENALSHDPQLRFQSAGELADALAQAFAHRAPGRAWGHTADGATSDAHDPAFFRQSHTGVHAADTHSESPLSRQRAQFDFGIAGWTRRPVLVISASAVLGLLLATLGFVLVQRAAEHPAAAATRGPPLASLAIAPASAELESIEKPAPVPSPCLLPPATTNPPPGTEPKRTGEAAAPTPKKRRYFRTTREPDYGI